MNYKNLLQSTISSSANLFVNKKLVAIHGIEVASLIAFLVDKENYHDEEEFYATNIDIQVYTGISEKRLNTIKKICIDHDLFQIIKKGSPIKSFYKINHKKLLEILSSETSILTLAYERLGITEKKLQDYTLEELANLTKKELVLICKKNKIPYKGTFKKEKYVEAILKKIQLLQNGVTSYPKTASLVTPKGRNQLPQNGVQKKTNRKNTKEKKQTEKTETSVSDKKFLIKPNLLKEILKDHLQYIDKSFLTELATCYRLDQVQYAYEKSKHMDSKVAAYMRGVLKKTPKSKAKTASMPVKKMEVVKEQVQTVKKSRESIITKFLKSIGVETAAGLSRELIKILNRTLINSNYEEIGEKDYDRKFSEYAAKA